MPRSGTTFLYHTLGQHPTIFVPFIKETDYFSVNYDLGPRWYLGLFREMLPHQVGFDISPSYFIDPSAVDRILGFNRNAKVVLAVRDPAEFAASLYCQLRNAAWRMPVFESFIDHYSGRLGPARLDLAFRENLVPRRLEQYRKGFGDNLLFYCFALFKKDPLFVLQAIESFVGVPRHFTETTFENVVINAADRKNLKLFSYLMGQLKRRGGLAFVKNASIRRILRSARTASDRMSRKAHDDSATGQYPPEYMRIAEEALADQRAAISEVFANAKMQLGSGTPYP
jgi:Sulfotransferase domain